MYAFAAWEEEEGGSACAFQSANYALPESAQEVLGASDAHKLDGAVKGFLQHDLALDASFVRDFLYSAPDNWW